MQYSILTEIPIAKLREHLAWRDTDNGVFDWPIPISTRLLNQTYRSNAIASLRKKQIRPYGKSHWKNLDRNYTPNNDFKCRENPNGISIRFPALTLEQFESQFRPPPSQETSQQTGQENMPPMPSFRRASFLGSPPVPTSAVPPPVLSSIVPSTVLTQTTISRDNEGEVTRMLCNQMIGDHFFHYVVELSLDDNGNVIFELPGGGAFSFFLDSNIFTVDGIKRSAMLASYVSSNTVDVGCSINSPAFVFDQKTLVFSITNGVINGIYDHLIEELKHHTPRLGEDLKNSTDAINAWKVEASSRGCQTRRIAFLFKDLPCPFEKTNVFKMT